MMPVEFLSNRPIGTKRLARAKGTKSATVLRPAGSSKVDSISLGLLSMTQTNSSRVRRFCTFPSTATVSFFGSIFKTGSWMTSPFTVIRPCSTSSLTLRREQTPEWDKNFEIQTSSLPMAAIFPDIASVRRSSFCASFQSKRGLLYMVRKRDASLSMSWTSSTTSPTAHRFFFGPLFLGSSTHFFPYAGSFFSSWLAANHSALPLLFFGKLSGSSWSVCSSSGKSATRIFGR
mmetsp:Transcript_7346/g.16623  ORF Transcript_7346/g.16623 Transcript_7346/m.16623 type:complete len:232 (-) Transcript_7346:407-1102(-)